MKKSKSVNDFNDLNDKQYKAILLLVKLVSSLSVEVHDLTKELKRQSQLIDRLLANTPLEEDPV